MLENLLNNSGLPSMAKSLWLKHTKPEGTIELLLITPKIIITTCPWLQNLLRKFSRTKRQKASHLAKASFHPSSKSKLREKEKLWKSSISAVRLSIKVAEFVTNFQSGELQRIALSVRTSSWTTPETLQLIDHQEVHQSKATTEMLQQVTISKKDL